MIHIVYASSESDDVYLASFARDRLEQAAETFGLFLEELEAVADPSTEYSYSYMYSKEGERVVVFRSDDREDW